MRRRVFSNFLADHAICSLHLIKEVALYEHELTAENFDTHTRHIATAVFGHCDIDMIMSGHKFFDRPPLNDPEMYKKGLHVFRIIFSRYRAELRDPKKSLSPLKVIPNFFSPKVADMLKTAIETFPKYENKQPDNLVAAEGSGGLQLVVFGSIFSACSEFLLYDKTLMKDPTILEYFANTSYVQRLECRPQNGDIQKVAHSDVFFPCMKYWWFPDAVTADDGCFWYAKGSTSMRPTILDWHYEQSIAVAEDVWNRERNKGHGEGSFRAFPEELEKMGLKLSPIEARAGDLVMADTSGFHCRGEPKHPFLRQALHGAIRMDDCFSK